MRSVWQAGAVVQVIRECVGDARRSADEERSHRKNSQRPRHHRRGIVRMVARFGGNLHRAPEREEVSAEGVERRNERRAAGDTKHGCKVFAVNRVR